MGERTALCQELKSRKRLILLRFLIWKFKERESWATWLPIFIWESKTAPRFLTKGEFLISTSSKMKARCSRCLQWAAEDAMKNSVLSGFIISLLATIHVCNSFTQHCSLNNAQAESPGRFGSKVRNNHYQELSGIIIAPPKIRYEILGLTWSTDLHDPISD